MPSFTETTAILEIDGGQPTFVPPRWTVTAGSLRINGATPAWSIGSDPSTSVTVPELDRLTSFDQLLNRDGTPSVRFMAIWQDMCERIEEAFTNLTGDVEDLAAIVARLAAAEALATAASNTATTAANTISIVNSYPDPTGVLTAANTGTITISAHVRRYADGTSANVNSGSVSGFSSGQVVTVYYDDAARVGGAVSYQGTTNAVAQTGNRHVVGTVTIPAAGQPAATGDTVTAPGTIPRSGDTRDYEFIP